MQWLLLLAKQRLRPVPLKVFKPNKGDASKGVCAVFNLRINPAFTEIDGTTVLDFDKTEGGLFVDLVPQKPKLGPKGYPEFDYTNKQTVITAKLGFPDVTKLLVSIERVRAAGKTLPAGYQSKQSPNPTTLSLFHKSGTSTTGISYSFGPDNSTLRISKSASKFRSINLTLDEERALYAYLVCALELFLEFGGR